LAAASFLETTNLSGLGLSTDRVYGHLTDLETKDISSSADLNAQPISTSGLKIMSDVMDGSYRMLDGIGRLWQRTTDMDIETAKTLKLRPEGPLSKFMNAKSVDELKIGEVTELLADYKRLAAILKQSNII
ncbi:hypothetical protein BDF14DRAFT_1732230, partial [Spinellus fusiger]